VKKVLIISVALILVMAFLFSSCAPAATPAPAPAPAPAPKAAPKANINLIFSSGYPPPPHMDTTTQLWWVDEISKRTNNRVTWQKYLGGALASTAETFDLVGKGAIDVGPTQYGMHPAEVPMWEMERCFIDGPSDARVAQNAWWKMYDQFDTVRNAGQNSNQMLLWAHVIGPYNILSYTPIKTLADLKGKIIGGWGVFVPKYFAPVGASAVATAGPDRYLNLKQKLIDASWYTSPDTKSYKLYEVAKNYTLIGQPCPLPYSISMNLDKWNSLDKDLQDLFMSVGREASYVQVAALEKGISEAEQFMKDQGVTFYNMSPEDLTTWTNLCEYIPWDFATQMEAKGLPAHAMLQAWVDFCKGEGWKFKKDWKFTQ